MESMLAAYGSGAAQGLARRGQAHPQHRHRRRHHQARPRREGQRDRDRGACISAAGCRWSTRAAASCGSIRRASYLARRGRLRLEPRRRGHRRRARPGRGGDGRRAGGRADAAADAARDRAPLADRSARRSRPHRRRDVLRRRRRIRLRPRERATSATWAAGSASAIRATPRRRRAAVAAAAGGRMHPRHRARRVGIQRAALRQHDLHLEARRRCCRAATCRCCSPTYACGETIDPRGRWPRRSARHFTAFDLVEGEAEVALAFRWQGAPSYERLAAFARGIGHGLATTIAAQEAALPHARRRHRADARARSCARSCWSRARSW